jgi:hypothetical protein
VTLAELLADLKRRLGDETGLGIHTDARLTTDLNDGYEWVDSRVNPIRKYTESTIPAATATIALPTDFRAFADGGIAWKETSSTAKVQLTRVGVRELDERLPDWDDADAALGTPKFFLFEPQASTGYAVTLVPTSNEGGTVYFDYHPTITALSAGTDEPWGGLWAEHHRVIVRAAEVLARQREGNADEEGKSVQRREEAVALFTRALNEQAPARTATLRANTYRKGFRYGR